MERLKDFPFLSSSLLLLVFVLSTSSPLPTFSSLLLILLFYIYPCPFLCSTPYPFAPVLECKAIDTDRCFSNGLFIFLPLLCPCLLPHEPRDVASFVVARVRLCVLLPCIRLVSACHVTVRAAPRSAFWRRPKGVNTIATLFLMSLVFCCVCAPLPHLRRRTMAKPTLQSMRESILQQLHRTG